MKTIQFLGKEKYSGIEKCLKFKIFSNFYEKNPGVLIN